ncbi:MAG: 2Fe-2S iron-sulfur cluster-binding protein [Acidobacteriota bacterium]
MSESALLPEPPVLAVPERPETATARLLQRDGTEATFEVIPGQSLLDSALDGGVDMEHGCRVGACGACAHAVVEGAERMEPPDELEASSLARYELTGPVRLCCRARSKGPVVLETV